MTNQGCEYCLNEKPLLKDDYFLIDISENGPDDSLLYVTSFWFNDSMENNININYCPMCGRKLSEV